MFCFAVAQSAEIEKVHRIPNTKMNVTDLLKRIDEEASDVQSISRYLHEDVSLDLTFTTFVSKICQKIGSLIGTEETVHPDLTHFKLELASFLRGLQCPFENLIAGELDQRLEHPADRKCLVEFLVSEYIAAKRVSNLKDQKNHSDLTSLHALLHCLKLGQPPNDVQVQVLFSTMIDRIHCMSAPMKAQVISEPLFGGGKLSESQWKNLTEVHLLLLKSLPTCPLTYKKFVILDCSKTRGGVRFEKDNADHTIECHTAVVCMV